jgi:HD domain/Region found in RelA / SpoT proteins
MTGERLRQLQAEHAVFRENAVVAAYGLASRAHAGQTRRSGEPVLEHCIATAVILAELGLPAHVVAAGLLHDVLCDTDTQLWQLADTVPPHVAALVGRVAQLNRLSQAYRDNTHSLQAEAMLDMLTSMDDVSALLIKLADRLHNMRTISSLPRCKQVRVASETLDVFAVLANRLGAWSIKAELEDLSFKALNPEEYHAVADAIASRCAAAGGGLSAGIEELTAALAAAGLEVADVSGRVKNVYGVWRKVQKLIRGSGRRCAADAAAEVAAADPAGSVAAAAADSLPPSPSPGSPAAAAAAAGTGGSFADVHARRAALADAVSRVYDVQALRVVVPHKHDCYSAMRVVQGLWPSMPDRIKDYIRQRKANGYQVGVVRALQYGYCMKEECNTALGCGGDALSEITRATIARPATLVSNFSMTPLFVPTTYTHDPAVSAPDRLRCWRYTARGSDPHTQDALHR